MSVLCKGYHGILCSACTDGHGKVRQGNCIKCGNRVKSITYSCILAISYVLLAAMMARQALFPHTEGNGGLGNESATKDVHTEAGHSILGESSSLLVGQSSSELATAHDSRMQVKKPSGQLEIAIEKSISKGRSFAPDILKVRRVVLSTSLTWFRH